MTGPTPVRRGTLPLVPRRPPRDRPGTRRWWAAVVALAASFAAGCGDDGGSDAGQFCADVRADVAGVVSPSLASTVELDATLERYRALAELAPPAIAEEWSALVLNLETAATVVPDDPDSVQRAVAQAYATEKSAVAVADWLRANCAIDVGPVATIVPQDRPTPASTPAGSDPAATVPLSEEPAG
jgi:hypothetical protein